MTTRRNRTPQPPRCVETKVYRVQARGADALLLPRNAVEDAFWTRRAEVDALFETLDGKRSRPRFVAAWNDKEGEYAERIFFEKELREINPGMSDIKIRGRIVRAIAVAQMLYKEIYGI